MLKGFWEAFNGEMFGCCRKPTEVDYLEISYWHLPEYKGATLLSRMEKRGCLGCSKGLESGSEKGTAQLPEDALSYTQVKSLLNISSA